MVFGFAVLAAAIRIVFWIYTDRVWEDALITILHADNAVNGIGLTHFKVDEPRIHGFTSPLSVLIPLVGEVLHAGWGLTTMRVASIAASVATVILAGSLVRRTPGMTMPLGLAAMACAYLAIEHHQILWGMAGMETQVACAVLLFSAWCYVVRRYALLGVAAALCVLVRPDFAIWTAIIGAFLLVDCREQRSLRPLLTTVGIAVALYLPWIVFATLYYGSPVPNTILAKAAGYPLWRPDLGSAGAAISGVWERLYAQVIVLLGPAFGGHGTGFVPLFANGRLAAAMLLMVAVSLVAAFRERRREILLLHAFFAAYTAYYIFLVPVIFGWYIVPYSTVGILLAAHGLATLLRPLRDERLREALAWGVCVAYIGLFATFLPTTFRTERDIQALIEEPVRVAIGKYLNTTPPDTTIAGEPLGFIGYYSKRTYYDFPGLASRRVVDHLRRTHSRDFFYLLRELQPDYLALRPSEAKNLATHPDLGRWLNENYEMERRFTVPEEDRRRIFLVQRNIDCDFVLLHRKSRGPDIVEASRLGPPLARIEPAIEGSWSREGGFHGVPAAPQGVPWYGSWNGNDANVGRISFALPPLHNVREIGIPFLTGPMATDLVLKIVDSASGETLLETDWPPIRADRWGVWRVTVPESALGHALAFVAEDRGRGWGQWLAVAAPHALVQR